MGSSVWECCGNGCAKRIRRCAESITSRKWLKASESGTLHESQPLLVSVANSIQSSQAILALIAEEEVQCIMSWLDAQSFALGVAPACRFLSRLIKSDSFEGWFRQIQSLHRMSPWTAKRTIESIIMSDHDLKANRFRTYLSALDREYAVKGQKLIPQALRAPCTVSLPHFFDCQEDTFIFVCKACGSCVAPVDFTVGRGVMGFQRNAFILQPDSTMPFCCGVHKEREMILSSGMYTLLDLSCPNGTCDSTLGWKYEDCLPMDGVVPPENFHKIGQYWMFAETLKVVTPTGSFPGCTGEHFYLMNNFP